VQVHQIHKLPHTQVQVAVVPAKLDLQVVLETKVGADTED
jgi:hypothetical protein